MEQTQFDRWRKCWESYLLGEQMDENGPYTARILASIDRMASLDLDFKGYEDDSECTVASPVFGLRARALAYRTKGSRYYRDPAVLRQVMEELEKLHHDFYNTENAPDIIENWWAFEIGLPLRILDILILLYDEIEDRDAQVRKYTDVILHFRDAYKASSRGREETGANLMWKCHILLLTGILRHETEWIEWANAKIPGMLQYSHAIEVPRMGKMLDDGFYEDGSFIQHYMFSYTGGYGKHFLSILSGLMFAFRGEECLQIPEENVRFLGKAVRESYLPLLYQGRMMDVCRGREPSRYWCEDRNAGAIVLRALLYLSAALPEKEGEELTAALKEQLSRPQTIDCLLYDFHPSAEYFVTPSLAERLKALDESKVEAAAPLAGHFNFGVMCKPVHRTSRYAFAVSMYSRQIACYEKLMKESTKFWHVSDGATYLYTGAGNTYSGNYYAAADMQRLAGTTVERSPRRAEDPYYNWYMPEARNTCAFAGGTTLSNAGIAGMQYMGQGNGKERTLKVQKSWFMFEKEIVCLGSGISSTTDNPVETIISSDRLLDKDLRFRVLAGTDGKELPVELNGKEMVLHTDRIYISQVPQENAEDPQALSGLSEGCGYYFPGGAEIHILAEHRRGTWNSVEINPEHVSENDYLTMWIAHGSHPENADYSYVILPACTEQEWMERTCSPALKIEENSVNAHAVRHLEEKLLGINFWQDAPYTCQKVTSEMQASFLARENGQGNFTEVSAADPTQQERVLEYTGGEIRPAR